MRDCRLAMAALVLVTLAGCTSPPLAGTHAFVDVGGGTRLHVETFGSGGTTVVFLHPGLHHFDNSFVKQRDVFAASRRVVGIDQRGHGHCPDDDRPYAYGEMADDTAAVILRLGTGPVDLVGHSDGGNVALLLAAAHPELVRRVVVSGANLRAGLPPEELARRATWSAQQVADAVSRLERRLPPAFKSDYEAVAPDGAQRWPTHVAKSYKMWLTPVVIDAAALKSVRAPVLVMAGDKDFSSVEDTAEIYRGLERAQLFIVPGSGHATFDDRPDLVNAAILEFLSRP